MSGSLSSASFAPKVDFTTGSAPISVAVGDLDGDGKLELAVANLSNNSASVMSKSVQWNAAQSRLEVAVFGASLPLPTLSAGVLATINVQVAATATPGATELGIALASLGDTEGQDVAVDQSNGALTITDGAVRNLLYLPVVVR